MSRLITAAVAAIAFSVSTSTAQAHDTDGQPIRTGSELLEWCRMESEARFIGENRRAYNWTARHFERGNQLHVEGRWRVDGVPHVVECRVARGALREFAHLDIRKA